MKIKELIEATGAKILRECDENLEVHISTDTRTIQAGDFYLPLKGESFDGEKFIPQALEKGAVGAFCTQEGGTLQVKDNERTGRIHAFGKVQNIQNSAQS